MTAALLAALLIALITAASASASCARPPNTIWTGSAMGPRQSNTWESFVKVEPETFPGSELLEFNGRTTVNGQYELEPGKFVPESFTGAYGGAIQCTGAEHFEAALEGTVGPYSGIKSKVKYTGTIQGTTGSGSWESDIGEHGTWTASLFAVAESAGSRPGEVEMINPSSSVATSLSAETAPGGLPEGLVAPVGSLSYEVTELKSSLFNITFKLPPGSHPTGAYKIVGGEYLPYPPSKTKIEGETITVELQDNGPYDEDPAVGTLKDPIVPVAASVPEFGRCVLATSERIGMKTVYRGKYGSATCTSRSSTDTGKYEWSPGVSKGHFETAGDPGSKVTLEATNKVKVTCTGEHSVGEVTGVKSVGNVVLTLTGCESAGQKCSTSSLSEGEIQTETLEGVIGIDSATVKAGKESRKAGLDLYPVGNTGTFAEYTCGGGSPATLSGSVIAAAPTDKMFTTATVKDLQAKGMQKPERFEGGDLAVLTNASSEQIGLATTATQTNEEAFEINAYY